MKIICDDFYSNQRPSMIIISLSFIRILIWRKQNSTDNSYDILIVNLRPFENTNFKRCREWDSLRTRNFEDVETETRRYWAKIVETETFLVHPYLPPAGRRWGIQGFSGKSMHQALEPCHWVGQTQDLDTAVWIPIKPPLTIPDPILNTIVAAVVLNAETSEDNTGQGW